MMKKEKSNNSSLIPDDFYLSELLPSLLPFSGIAVEE